MINCKIRIDARTNFSLFTFIYGALDDNERHAQWSYMNNIANHFSLLCIVFGDLSFVLSQDEKEGGNLISQSVLDDSN